MNDRMVIDGPANPFTMFTGTDPINLINFRDFKVERTFEFEDKDFAHRIMVLPSYSVQFTPMNITAMTWPGHEVTYMDEGDNFRDTA